METDSCRPPGPLLLLSLAALEFPTWGGARSLLMKVGLYRCGQLCVGKSCQD